MSNYRNANLLYKAALSVWTARKKDKGESTKVNSAAGAVDGAANVHKQLLPDSPELLAVGKWATSFRTWVYDTTLPWDDCGWRIGRVVRHMDFMAEAADRIRVGDSLVDDFIAKYEQSVEEAKFKLNGMFNALDYPTINEVRCKFSFTIECMAMPNSEDFRVVDGVDQGEVDRLVKVATDSTELRIADAMKEAYARLFDVVNKMATTLSMYSDKSIKKFNNTLVGNIATLVAIMPALNLTNDPALTALTAKAERLATYDVGDLRDNDTTRGAAIAEARALAKEFAAMVPAAMPEVPMTRVYASPQTKDDLYDKLAVSAGIKAEVQAEQAQQEAIAGIDAAMFAGGWGE